MLPHSKASIPPLMAFDALPLLITMYFLIQSCLKLAKKNNTNIFLIATLFIEFLSYQINFVNFTYTSHVPGSKCSCYQELFFLKTWFVLGFQDCNMNSKKNNKFTFDLH